MNQYARNTDPNTSHEAADRIVHRVDLYPMVVTFLKVECATYRMVGEWLASLHVVPSWEEGRRVARSMVDAGILRLALDEDGAQIQLQNTTGRWAEALEVAPRRRVLKRPK